NQPVNVLADGPAGSTDEGRAMLENAHDVAPGASLAFNTTGGSELAMNHAILALANTAKSNIINDDVGFLDGPFFQDGLISQAFKTVTAQGVTYLSAAGNVGNQGYLSTFRAASSSITGIGAGTFMNFNPGGGTTAELPITTSGANARLIFEYDQPFQTHNAAGSAGQGTSHGCTSVRPAP